MSNDENNSLQATPDINLATFIMVVKKIEPEGHYHEDGRLFVQFKLPEEEMKKHKMEYMNSTYSVYDAQKRNFLRLLK